MSIDIALVAVLRFVSTLLSDSLKERLKPKDSPTKARERAFRLYECLGDVESKTAAFIAELKQLVAKTVFSGYGRPDYDEEKRARHDWSGPASAMSDLLLSLEELEDALRAVNPQLEVHMHEMVKSIQDFQTSRSGIVKDVQNMGRRVRYELEREDSRLIAGELNLKLAEAEENAKTLHSAISDFRKFLASEFKFKESF